MSTIRQRERDAVLQSLRAGVVPRTGQHLIQVGRLKEIETLLADIERCTDGGSAVRFVIGAYGSGKTFFLNLVRSIAHEKRVVTVHADLSPDRRLQASGGQARSLYSELMRNLGTRAKPDGGAMQGVVERFVTEALKESRETGTSAEILIHRRLEQLSQLTGGYDFAQVIACYWNGHETGNDQLKTDAVRWLRAEFSTKTDARAALGVRTIIDDHNFYDHLKLMASFVRLAGFGGLLAAFDEMVNLYKIANAQSRNSNYEQILRILNDALQGTAAGLGVLMGGTPEFLMDTRRGLYSYAALQSRLAENTFAKDGLVDFNSPVLRLASLTREDFYLLISKIRHVQASGNAASYLLPDEGLHAFMAHCEKKLGESYFRTPRTTITAFVHLLSVLEQNRHAKWEELLDHIAVDAESEPEAEEASDEGDELASFKL